MALTVETLGSLPVESIRSMLPGWVVSHVAGGPVNDAIFAAVTEVVRGVSDAELLRLRHAFSEAGDGYRLHPADPVARAITRSFMAFLSPGWTIEGRDVLDRFLSQGPARRLIVANHLSYTDTQLTDSILTLAGHRDLADRLVAIAGPKVYTEPWRRMAAVALNTRKTAQSSTVATEQDSLGPRELAAIAYETIADCERLADQGYVVVLYPEGARSRTGRLRPFLRAAARYLQVPDLQVLPMAQTGSEHVYPIESELMYPLPCRIAFGEPFVAADYPGKVTALAEAHRRVAALLPPAYQPAPEDPAVG